MTPANKSLYKKAFFVVSSISHKSFTFAFKSRYINNIETGKSMPSLSGFFYICDYLDITARDFFDDGNEYPEQLRAVFQDMQKLSPEQLQNIHAIVKGLLR